MTEFGAPPGSFPPPPVPPPPPPTGGLRTGPPWEGTGPAVQRFIDTAKGVLLDPATTFRNLRREGGLGGPVSYYLIGALLSVVAQSVWELAGFGGFDRYGYGGGFLSTLIVGAIAVLAGLFIGSGIVHLFLMLLGGARYPFEATLRTLAYSHGSAAPIGIIPICGGIVAMVWGVVAAIIGLAQVHETSTGKAAGAVLIPFVLCCALLAIFAASIAAMLGFAAVAASR